MLLPLFFTFKPLEKATLRDRLTALASKAGTRIMGVYEWTLSDRTKKANAALTGMGNTRRILLSDTLLAEYSDDEIEVILAHELAHHVHRDIWTSVLFDMALTFAGFFAAHMVLQRAVPLFGLQGIADPAGMPILLLTAGTIGLCVKPLLNAVSRSHERRADSYALRMTRESVGVHHSDEAAGPAEPRRRQPLEARAGVLLHASANQGTAARGAILGAIGVTGAVGVLIGEFLAPERQEEKAHRHARYPRSYEIDAVRVSFGWQFEHRHDGASRSYTRVAICGRSPVRDSLNSITRRLGASIRHIDPRVSVMRAPCSSGGRVA